MSDDYSQPGRINWRLYKYISSALSELDKHIRIGGNQECPDLIILKSQVELYASDYPSAISEYTTEMENIDRKYGRSMTMSIPKHIRMTQVVMNTLNEIGTFRLRERNPYPEIHEPDDYDMNIFSFDISNVDSEIPVVRKLTEVYYSELRKEFENKPDHSRRKEAERRAKRAYIFVQKYREYEAGGFKRTDIENIFGIDRYHQDILQFWINELLPYGISTSLFAKAGMGKSNTSTFICQMILIMRPQWDIITNLPIMFSPLMDTKDDFKDIKIERFYFVKNMSELLLRTADIGLNDRVPAIILDEFDSSMTTEQMRSKMGQSLNRYMYMERHWDTQGPLFIYHTRKDIPVPMRDSKISHDVYMITVYSNYITRRNKRIVTNPNAWDLRPTGGKRYLPIPLTTLPYHTLGTSPFEIDVDTQWLDARITGTQKEALRQIRKLVPERGWDKELQRQQEKERERQEKEERRKKEKEEKEQREKERKERMEQRRIQDQLKRMGKKNDS